MFTDDQRDQLLKGCIKNPHAVLGFHGSEKGGLEFRALLPGALSLELVDLSGESSHLHALSPLGDDGFFHGVFPKLKMPFPYRLRVCWKSGVTQELADPYAFDPILSEADLKAFNRGVDTMAYRKLGAHSRCVEGIDGFGFSVWAPNAIGVSVLGKFNGWDGVRHPMRLLGETGVWELFVPGVEVGAKYKFRVFSQQSFQDKADPFATFCEGPPGNASITWQLEDGEWSDCDWMNGRISLHPKELPLSVYEVHLASWLRNPDGSLLTYLELADQLPKYVKDMGFTHVELLPLAEHPLPASWGYQVTGFFAPTSRFGPPEDFMRLVDAFHLEGIGVIMDWVPAHFPRDDFALARFDGDHSYPPFEYADSRIGEHQDWGTLVFDYSRLEVRSFLMSSAVAWLDRYHVDGLRVDAVASMLYLDYSRKREESLLNRDGEYINLEAKSLLQETNQAVHDLYPGTMMIAEESTAFPQVTGEVSEGGLGFDFKWNMGWMHDVLQYFRASPAERPLLSEKLTFAHSYQFTENFVQVFSHDEVVHGKSPMIFKMGVKEGAGVTEQADLLRALYVYMWAWPGKKTLFMGNEFGQTAEWNFDASLDWDLLQYEEHAGLKALVRDLNHLYLSNQFLGAGDLRHDKFRWFECGDSSPALFSFCRFGNTPQETLLAVFNFSGQPVQGHRVGVHAGGEWKMILHSEDKAYGKSLDACGASLQSEPLPAGEWGHSLALDLNAPSAVLLKPA